MEGTIEQCARKKGNTINRRMGTDDDKQLLKAGKK